MASRMKKMLSGTTLKYIAMFTMLIDHTAAVLVPYYHTAYMPMRIIGRLAFPIYCFLLVEGFLHTRNPYAYAGRLAIFALISEIPFDWALFGRLWNPEYQNVFFTLCLGMVAMTYYEKYMREGKAIGSALAIALPALAAWALKTDYGAEGVILILFFYLFRENQPLAFLAGGVLLAMMGSVEAWAICAFALIYFYNGQKGSTGLPRFVFYGFYPVHLIILGILNFYLR